MKTTLDIADALFARAKAHAKRSGQPLRAVVEEGLRRVLDTAPPKPYVYQDLSVGKPDREPAGQDVRRTPEEWRELMYGTELDEVERIMGRSFVERHLGHGPRGPDTKRRTKARR